MTALVAPRIKHQVPLQYPGEALEEGEDAKVSVLVRVGTEGQVLGIDFESGPQVFKSAALQAASHLEFVPASKNPGLVPLYAAGHQRCVQSERGGHGRACSRRRS